MKKSLINILALAVGVANLVLMAILIFAIVPAMNNTNALVTKICTAIDLELENSYGPTNADKVPFEDIQVYNISEMTINLKAEAGGGDGKPHYMITSVTVSMNSTNKDYETYSATMAEKEGLMKNRISKILSSYTKDEAQANVSGLEDEVLASLQDLYKSDFIIDVSFNDYIFQ